VSVGGEAGKGGMDGGGRDVGMVEGRDGGESPRGG